MAKTRSLLGLSFLLAALASCASPPPAKQQMYVGAAVSVKHLTEDPAYKKLVDQFFSVITPENEMKWGETEKERGKEVTTDLDTLHEYVIKNGKKLRGHAILAHTQNPNWVSNLSKEDMKAAAYKHMELIFKKYAKSMISLDVCNEIIDDTGGVLRQTVWLQTWGEEFIVDIYTEARRLAKLYNPDVLLFINDFSIEEKNVKSDKMLELATSLHKKGILDAVGFQSHLEVGKFPKDFQKNLQRFIDAGLLVALSELDIRIKLQGRSESEIAKDREQQTKDFEAAFEVCAGLDGCLGITLWGVSDQYSWIPTTPGTSDAGEALMFDKDYKPKPSFDSLKGYFTPSRRASRCA
ncbi:hypothetical protein PtA15_9A674 [Puccinia triticina]|uniref:Beta-xylanase n=1 Tax=Puccinia triticina TaxID=208348 RepID=A0ABY7CX20_9BASI|nr:uncharacterized protein PtA15_9A674 [Puccinia triticina]WAQ88547.1 hypothetical protein PtA15_9A674 [Puccinia triticina]WAR60724.1 hypothetical protein PtB15_9B663 [Puccinia triticina]